MAILVRAARRGAKRRRSTKKEEQPRRANEDKDPMGAKKEVAWSEHVVTCDRRSTAAIS
jgi:hypothetical protein